jgi:hypothetical protein
MQASGSAAIGIAGAAVKMLIVQDECLQVVLVFSEDAWLLLYCTRGKPWRGPREEAY